MSVLYYTFCCNSDSYHQPMQQLFPQGWETPVYKAGVVKWLIFDPFNGIFIHLLSHLFMSWFWQIQSSIHHC